MEDNRNIYNKKSVVNRYADLNELIPVELKVFELFKKTMSEGLVLDIGIGGGRTTAYLIDKCKQYVGVDYSKEFVGHVKQKYTTAEICLMDARNLSSIAGNTFDFVNFSFNGIDYVDLNDRIKILNEIHRILKPGGVFFFSTHNKSHATFNKLPWMDNRYSIITNIKTFLKLVLYLPVHLVNKKKEVHEDSYAIINDSAHNFSLMTFYTSPEFLKQQLRENGFTDIQLFLKSGDTAPDAELDDWIFVVCKKSAL